MKKAPSPFAAARGFSSDKDKQIATLSLTDRRSPAQVSNDVAHVATFWKSVRNRREAIQITLKQYEGNPFLDCRVFEMNAMGRMVPTRRGLAIGIKTLPAFAKAVGDGLRKAHALGLVNEPLDRKELAKRLSLFGKHVDEVSS